MSKKRNKGAGNQEPKISQETKNSILAVFLIGLAAILILAGFEKAGPVGHFIFVIFNRLVGVGYYLLPIIVLVVALLLIIAAQRKVLLSAFVGSTALVMSVLGLIDIIFPKEGGLIGVIVGLLEWPFGKTAGIILTATLGIAALLLTLNASIRFQSRSEKIEEEEREKTAEVTVNLPAEEKKPEETSEETPEPEEESPKPAQKKNFPPMPLKPKAYAPPPLSLLKSSVEKPSAGDLRANANIIKRTLDSFGIPVEMGEISIGPKVTRYTLKPAEGVKLSRITALNQDLSLALAAHPIRIEAPIPGKSLVGVEVPNKSAAIVRLGSLMNYEGFVGSGPLTFILGRDVNGDPILSDIEKMPHLLIAGATGSGKSVAIHSLVISLLYKNSPDVLKLILIDPKRVELSVYDDIPHLITPVITEGKKAINALRWGIQEMERRYEILLEAGSRDIISYNKSHENPLPYLLIVIDELADLMAAYGREVEASIIRLAQMARATGIHLIVSTQRPSVEVITGLIKANITSRVALQVASQVDSRTILDSAGAEKLLGGGDMLFISAEFSKPRRIQGAYISEEEINKVADFLKSRDAKETMSEPDELALESPDILESFEDNGEDDELYNEAVKVVKEAKKASASLLQRRLKVGYARAARLLDIMESKGLIGPGEGAKPRDVYINENE